MRRIAAVAVAALVVATTACDPVPPRVPFTVTSTASAADHTPGDGVCEATPGEGDCTLPAAVAEANAVARARIQVPAGEYWDLDLTITGDIELNWGAPAAVGLGRVTVTVAEGGTLWAAGLRTLTDPTWVAEVEVTVAGALNLDRSFIVEVPEDLGGVALRVLAGGGAIVTTSTLFGGRHAVDNAGSVIIDRSTLLNLFNGRINTTGTGTSIVRASLLSRAVSTSAFTDACTGTPAISIGYSHHAPAANGCTTSPTDVISTPAPTVSGVPTFPGYGLERTSLAIDVIPVGHPLCPPGSVDLAGNPRGGDGDGDGTGGCDIGAVERVSPPAGGPR